MHNYRTAGGFGFLYWVGAHTWGLIVGNKNKKSEPFNIEEALCPFEGSGDTDSTPGWQQHEFADFVANTLLILLLLDALLGGIAWISILDILGVDGVSIDDDVGNRVPAKQTACDLINSTYQHQYAWFVLLPEVIVGDCVGKLNLPGDKSPSPYLPWLPQPSTDNILAEQGFVNGRLIFYNLLQIGFTCFGFQGHLNLL